MVSFAKDLYTSEEVTSKVSTIKWKMACGIGMINLFFITMSQSTTDLFDIYPAVVFKQRSFRKSNLKIIGIASSPADANSLVETMINECIRETGDVMKVREYFEKKYS